MVAAGLVRGRERSFSESSKIVFGMGRSRSDFRATYPQLAFAELVGGQGWYVVSRLGNFATRLYSSVSKGTPGEGCATRPRKIFG